MINFLQVTVLLLLINKCTSLSDQSKSSLSKSPEEIDSSPSTETIAATKSPMQIVRELDPSLYSMFSSRLTKFARQGWKIKSRGRLTAHSWAIAAKRMLSYVTARRKTFFQTKLTTTTRGSEIKKNRVNNIPGQEVCGTASRRTSLYIVGGKNASIEDFPWMVQLVVPKSITPDASKYEAVGCAAAIVGNEWLLTAAHCIIDYIELRYRLLVGEAVANPEIEEKLGAYIGATELQSGTKSIIRFDPLKITLPENYYAKYFKNDIALIRLENPLEFSARSVFRPICLPEEDELNDFREGHACMIAGWGAEAVVPKRKYPVNLKSGEVFIKNAKSCNSSYQKLPPIKEKNRVSLNLTLSSTHMCAGGIDGLPDVCYVDSGGPLMCTSPTTGRFLATGIVSFGPHESQFPPNIGECGQMPSAYTDLRFFIPWIKQQILEKK